MGTSQPACVCMKAVHGRGKPTGALRDSSGLVLPPRADRQTLVAALPVPHTVPFPCLPLRPNRQNRTLLLIEGIIPPIPPSMHHSLVSL